MNPGDKYIIEVDKVFQHIDRYGEVAYAKMKGFNCLFFDEEGLSRLTPFKDSRWQYSVDYVKEMSEQSFAEGMEAGWELAQRITRTSAKELLLMNLNMSDNFEDLSEYGISCNVIVSNDVHEVKKAFDARNIKYAGKNNSYISNLTDILDYIDEDLDKIEAPVGSYEYNKQFTALVVEAMKYLNKN